MAELGIHHGLHPDTNHSQGASQMIRSMATQDLTVVRAKEFRFAGTSALERTRTASRDSRPSAAPGTPLRRTPRAASQSLLPRGTAQPLGGLHETTSPNSHSRPSRKGSSWDANRRWTAKDDKGHES